MTIGPTGMPQSRLVAHARTDTTPASVTVVIEHALHADVTAEQDVVAHFDAPGDLDDALNGAGYVRAEDWEDTTGGREAAVATNVD